MLNRFTADAQIDNMIQELLHAKKKIIEASPEKTQMEGQLSLFDSVQEAAYVEFSFGGFVSRVFLTYAYLSVINIQKRLKDYLAL